MARRRGHALDYSIDGELLRFAVIDATSHGVGATSLASVTLAGYRNARRSDVDLVSTGEDLSVASVAPRGELGPQDCRRSQSASG